MRENRRGSAILRSYGLGGCENHLRGKVSVSSVEMRLKMKKIF